MLSEEDEHYQNYQLHSSEPTSMTSSDLTDKSLEKDKKKKLKASSFVKKLVGKKPKKPLSSSLTTVRSFDDSGKSSKIKTPNNLKRFTSDERNISSSGIRDSVDGTHTKANSEEFKSLSEISLININYLDDDQIDRMAIVDNKKLKSLKKSKTDLKIDLKKTLPTRSELQKHSKNLIKPLQKLQQQLTADKSQNQHQPLPVQSTTLSLPQTVSSSYHQLSHQQQLLYQQQKLQQSQPQKDQFNNNNQFIQQNIKLQTNENVFETKINDSNYNIIRNDQLPMIYKSDSNNGSGINKIILEQNNNISITESISDAWPIVTSASSITHSISESEINQHFNKQNKTPVTKPPPPSITGAIKKNSKSTSDYSKYRSISEYFDNTMSDDSKKNVYSGSNTLSVGDSLERGRRLPRRSLIEVEHLEPELLNVHKKTTEDIHSDELQIKSNDESDQNVNDSINKRRNSRKMERSTTLMSLHGNGDADDSEYDGGDVDIDFLIRQEQLFDQQQQQNVNFEVGTLVRKQTLTNALRNHLFNNNNIDSSSREETSSLDTNKSSERSESSDQKSDSSRRRIAYIAYPTMSQDYDVVHEKREPLSQLSEISESTLDSDCSDTGENMDATSSREKREHLYKILVIGELGTGKTSFIKRYVHQFFSQNYRATIGVDFALKVLNWDQNTIIRLQLWDIAGQERFGNMTRVYYKEAVGAFIVFDVTRNATFDAVVKWKQDLDTKVQLSNGNPIPCILLANKCDQPKQGIVSTPAKMDEYVKENGFAGWFETSAKENINIEEAARALVNKILQNDTLTNGGGGGGSGGSDDTDRFGLENRTYQPPKEKCSC